MSRPTLRTNPVEVTAGGHLTELLYDDGGDDVVVCAAHGGAVEPGTAEQAVELATRLGATCWACLGYHEDGAFDAFHPASSAIDPAEYPLLGRIADRGFDTVVSLHGLGEDGVLVGGGLRASRKRLVRDRLAEALSVDVSVARRSEYAGTSATNFVNWLAADSAGLQLEQGSTARSTESGRLLDALAALIAEGRL